MRNTNFSIEEETGHFVVTSKEPIFGNSIFIEGRLQVLGTKYCKTVWNWDSELLVMTMDGKDVKPVLSNTKHALYEIVKRVESHHESVMRYERM